MSTIKDLKPSVVWNNFYALTRIPRPSGHEEKVSNYLYEWGLNHGLETYRDKVGNVIIRKPATKGYENLKTVTMQGHMDMVPAKTSESRHDFLKDPIETVIDGEWVKTKGTTLGADNGIGVSLALAVLESDVPHGPLEALFTVDEEQGMTGANALEHGVLTGDILLNLDEEEDGALCVGCAGGLDVTVTKKYKAEAGMPEGYKLYSLVADKGEGGHSGQDIPLGRINANKSVARVILPLLEEYGCLLVSMKGGSLRNAIPIECRAEILVPKLTEKTVAGQVAKIIDEILDEHKISDPKAEMTFAPVRCGKASEHLKASDALKFIRAIMACPHGVERMSETITGLAETSTNMALVNIGGGEFYVKSLTRSSVDSAKLTLALRQKSLFELIGCKVAFSGGYNGWKPNPDSAILDIMKKVYKKLNGNEPIVNATHGGLECGFFGKVYPDMDMIAFGPTLVYPHSPSEKLFIPSVGHTFEFLCEVLKNIPVKE